MPTQGKTMVGKYAVQHNVLRPDMSTPIREGTYSQHIVCQIGKRTNDIDEQSDFLGHGGLSGI